MTRTTEGKPRRKQRANVEGVDQALPADDRFAPHPGAAIDVVYVMGRAAHLVGARPGEVVGVALAGLVLPGLVVGAASLMDSARAILEAGSLLLFVGAWVLGLLLQTPLVGSAIEVHTDHRGRFADFLRRGVARLGSIVAASLAVVVIAAVAFGGAYLARRGAGVVIDALPLGFVAVMLEFVVSVVVLLLALRIVTAFSLVVPIILVEDLGPGDALRRSWALGWRNGIPIFLAVLIPALLVQGVLFLSSFMPAFISVSMTVVLGALLSLYHCAIIPVSYVVIREYVDGIDPARLLRSTGPRR